MSEFALAPIDPADGPTFALAARVVPMTTADAAINEGVVYVKAGTITAVQEANAPKPAGFEKVKVLDTHGTIYPGLIDLHDHLSYNALQLWDVPKKYENRDQWAQGDTYRKLITGPMKVLAHTPAYVPAIVRYVEAKCLVAGTTTSQGIALSSYAGIQHYYRGIVRNVEQTDDPDLPEAVDHIADVDAKDHDKFLKRLKQFDCLLLHLSEGTNTAAREHFLALKSATGSWAVTDSLSGIHCVALEAADFEVLAAADASMVWSPLSNLLLYGQTTKIAEAVKAGLTIGLGPDWSPSGSKNLLGELKIARLTANLDNANLSDFELLALATRNAGKILRWDGKLGTIEAGKHADLLIVRGQNGDPHSHLLACSEHDVELVVINGVPRYGASQPMSRLLGPGSEKAEAATIAGRRRLLNLEQPTSDPAVARLSLNEATKLLKAGLSRLPDLAKDLTTKPALELLDARAAGEAAFLVLDHDDLAGVDLRPHLPDRHGRYSAEPSPEMLAAPATPLPDLLEPLTLDSLTVPDDHRFLELLAKQSNLPAQIAAEIPNLY
jgi:cytosine/adenosine deaminase-related metal-dependent hydrolase